MPTSEAATAQAQLPVFDGKLAKWFVIAAGLAPAALLVWDALQGQLGVNDVNFAIRSTGMLGLVFMTLSLVVTPIRRLTGWNWIIGVRRNLGVFGFLYIAAHFTIFWLYDRDGSFSSTVSEIVERVYLWFGTASLVIMIPLAITSFDSMVTKIGPKRWKLLHRLAYVAVACGVIHFYLLVKADTFRPIVFSTVFGGLMAFRVVRGTLDRRAKKLNKGKKKKFWSGELVVSRIFEETHDVKTFRFTPVGGGPLPFAAIAGQYLNIQLEIDGKRVRRSYTIASSPTRTDYAEITVKRDGLASKHLHGSVKEGDVIKIGAPAGKFYFAGTEAKRVVLVAGGVGITPMMSVIRSLTERRWAGDMHLIFAVKRRADIIFERELEDLVAGHPNLHVTITLTQPDDAAPGGLWNGTRGRISRELIAKVVPDVAGSRVMLCGPVPQMQAARALFVELGVPNDEIREEEFVSPTASGDAAAEVADTGGEYVVHFKRSGKKVDLVGLTVLEAAEDNDIEIPFECRSGICGQCKCKLVSGRVVMESQDALTASDKQKGLILACQARPTQNCEVEA
jgi:ferredoxin-NADP reductase/DMSO/TMAO reductase YedYZ heme-binding membrane subunit